MLFCAELQAHSPRFDCYVEADQQIFCEGGFSDGSSARGVAISILNYEEQMLWSGKLDTKSQIRFKRPEGRFYLRFEGGSGHTLEIDHLEIQ